MHIYYIVFLILSALALLSMVTNRTLKFSCLVFASFILILLSGFREAGVGLDDFNYISLFTNIHNYLDFSEGKVNYDYKHIRMEPGFVMLNALLRYISEHYMLLFLVVSTISVSLNSYNFYKYTKYPVLAFIIYYAHNFLHKDITQLRAGIASAIILLAVDSVEKKRFYTTLKYILIAFSFHMSALVAFAPFVLRSFKLSRKRILILIFLAVLASLFTSMGNTIAAFILNSFNIEPIAYKIESYILDPIYNYKLGFFNLTTIKSLFLTLMVLFLWHRFTTLPYFTSIFSFYLSGVIIRLLLSDFAILSARLSNILFSVEPILITFFIMIFRNRLIKLLIAFTLILYALLHLFFNLALSAHPVASYKFSLF